MYISYYKLCCHRDHENAQESDSVDEDTTCEHTKMTVLHNLVWLNAEYFFVYEFNSKSFLKG